VGCRGCGHKQYVEVTPKLTVDMSDWVEVIPLKEGKVVVPEWDTIQLRIGETIRLPRIIVAKNSEFFRNKEDKYVDQILSKGKN
jgi:hypothetical protein